MTIRNCKKVEMKVEFISGYCELAEECAQNPNIKCGQCSPDKIIAGNIAIKKYCKNLLN